MRKMIVLLVLGSTLVLVGRPAFAEQEREPAVLQTVAAQASDQPDTMGPHTMGPSNGTIDPAPRFLPNLDSHDRG